MHIHCKGFVVQLPRIRIASMQLPLSRIDSRLLLTAVSLAVLLAAQLLSQENKSKAIGQNPSPMVEYARRHERVANDTLPGLRFEVRDLFSKPAQVFIPAKFRLPRTFDALIHFHGANFVVEYATSKSTRSLIAVTVTLGSGSKVYSDAFEDTTKFSILLDSLTAGAQSHFSHPFTLQRVILSGFSAGYGAIRRIISTSKNYGRVDAVLLLDGIHAGYIPERQVLFEGGRIDSTDLQEFLYLAEDASKRSSKKKFLITHSEIFPGTFVGTTEATDYILQSLNIKRQPILKWGPLGMQQLCVARKNHFAVLGFAGNTAPDHVDHLHGLPWFLSELFDL